jgi:hypothetical protein
MDSISTMFHLLRMATVVELVALNSNSTTFDELPPALQTLSTRFEPLIPNSWTVLRGQVCAMAAVVIQWREIASLSRDSMYWPWWMARELCVLLRNTEKKFFSVGEEEERIEKRRERKSEDRHREKVCIQ